MLEAVVTRHLEFEEAYELFTCLLDESEVRMAAYLAAMQAKGYDGAELAGLAMAMRDNALTVDLGTTCDTCGTGGDRACTINVSTAVALMLSCHARVAKHGNSSVTSQSGSSDVLSALGINVVTAPDSLREGMDACSFSYLHAPLYHPALQRIMPVRRLLGIRTVFNILGPLANPASPCYQLIGVSDREILPIVAEALCHMDVKRALVVHGDGLDEAHPSSTTTLLEVHGEEVSASTITPKDCGMRSVPILPVSSPEESARRIEAVLRGDGICEDRVLLTLNGALALHVVTGRDYEECADIARDTLEGDAYRQLKVIRNAYPKA